MFRKILAVGFALLTFNLLFFTFQETAKVAPGQMLFYGLGTVWFFLGTLAAQIFLLIAFYHQKNTRRQTYALSASAIAVAASWAALFRASAVDQFLLSVLAVSATFFSLYLFALRHEWLGAVSEIFSIPLQLFFYWMKAAAAVFGNLPEVVSRSVQFFIKGTPRVKVSSSLGDGLVRGLVITVPVLFLIGVLLVSADPIFAHTIQQLFNFQLPHFPSWLFYRTIYTLICFFAVAPLAWLMIRDHFHSPFDHQDFRKMHIEALMLSGAVAVLLGFFLLIQFRYLFSTVSETELHQFGVQTYSEYVKRGFNELLIVSVIVYLVAGFGMIVHRVSSEKIAPILRGVNVALLVEALIFIFSIMRRVWLYQSYHGLSRIRVYGMVFLIMLFFWTCTLIFRHFQKWQMRWHLIEFAWLVIVLFGTYFVNVDRVIATQFRPTVNNEVDYVYISRLSPDATDGWIAAYQWARSTIMDPALDHATSFTPDQMRHITYAQQIIDQLDKERLRLSEKYGNGQLNWSNWLHPEIKQVNMAELAAYQKLQPIIFTSELDTLKARVDFLQHMYQSSTPVPLDRSSDTPLVK